MMANFQNGLISRMAYVSSSGFLHRKTKNTCRLDFDMFLQILIFDPKGRFCKGYRSSMMANFQNHLISRIFGFFKRLLHRTTLNHR